MVTKSHTPDLHAVTFGDPSAAWAAAADASAHAHIRYVDAPVRRVLSLVPTKYGDMWTGAKGFYKVEPIVAEGGQVVLYLACRYLLTKFVWKVYELTTSTTGARPDWRCS